MTTEEKAIKYDEALEWMRKVYPTLTGADKEDAEHYFPELKESEDERIRKALITLTKVPRKEIFEAKGITKEQALTWLEKQKEQKPAEWNEEDEEALDMCLDAIPKKWKTKSGTLLTKWLKDNIHLKQEWSEEDERMLSRCIKSVECSKQFADSETYKAAKDAEMNWLKSLRFQPRQNPEAKLTGWVARDIVHNPYFGLGLAIFNGKPKRTGDCWTGAIVSQLPWKLFPDLKWETEPVEVEITIRKK